MGSCCSTPSPDLTLPVLSILPILIGVVVLVCFSLMLYAVKHLFTCLFVIHMSSLVRCLLKSLAHFLIPSCQVEYSYWLPIPGEDSISVEGSKEHRHANYQELKSKQLFPLLLGFRVTKEIITQSSTGWNNTSLT